MRTRPAGSLFAALLPVLPVLVLAGGSPGHAQVKNSQFLGKLGVEWLFLRNLGLGLSGSWARLDVDVDDPEWRRSVRLDSVGVSLGFSLRAP